MINRELEKYYGHEVKVETESRTLIGVFSIYTPPEDNEEGIASISLETDNFYYEIFINEIVSIQFV